MYYAYYKSPIGILKITAAEEKISAIDFVDESAEENNTNKHINECIRQLDLYFAGKLKDFSLNKEMDGTKFQQSVWNALSQIPYGKTVSYKNVAGKIGNSKAVRAVGNANGKNPIPIIVPCHRVIGSDNSLAGYSCGVWRKQWLLDHERKYA